jgi:hypothetical protein
MHSLSPFFQPECSCSSCRECLLLHRWGALIVVCIENPGLIWQ